MSTGQNSGDQYCGTFEGRFSSMFKTPQFLPPPEPFAASAKTYPSRNTGGNMGNRGSSAVKRAPAPPPPPPPGPSQQHQGIAMRS